MKNFTRILLALTLLSTTAFGRGKIQNEDVKSLSDLKTSAGTITGNLSSGSACIASPSTTVGIAAGMFAYDATTSANIPAGTTVVGIGTSPCTSGQIKLSANAAGTATGDTISFGGQASQLINDTKIWLTSTTPAQQLSTAITSGAIGGGGRSGVGSNLLSDANGQAYTPSSTSWTVTNGTGSADTVVFTDGLQSIKVTASAQTSVLSQDVTPTIQMSGQNMQATMWVKTSLTNVQVCAHVGGVATNCQAVSSNNTWAPYTSTFVGPASGSVGIEVSMTGSGTGSFNAQLGYVGKATSVAMVAPSMTDWTSTTLTYSAGFGTVTNAQTYVRREGDSAHFRGNFTWGTGTGTTVYLQLPAGYVIDTTKLPSTTNGTLLGKAHGADLTSGQIEASGIGHAVFYDGSTNNQVFLTRISGSTTTYGKSAGNTYASNSVEAFDFTVPIVAYSGSSQQQGYRPDATPASWSGYQDATSGWSTSSGSQADLSAGSGITLTEIANRNFGTVSNAGSSLPGISFTAPRVGRYHVCATLAILNSTTSNTSMYVVDGSGAFIASAYYGVPSAGLPNTISACGIYNIASVGSVTLKIQGKVASGTGSLWTNNSTIAHPIQWSIIELDAPTPTPFLTGSVTSNTGGSEHIERARIGGSSKTTACNSSPCATVLQSGSWLTSVTRSATGQYVLNIAAGEFSATPVCTCASFADLGVNECVRYATNGDSSTTIGLITQSNGTSTDTYLDVICMGPR